VLIMTRETVQKTARAAAPRARIDSGYSDETSPRIRAYLASVRPRRGSNFSEECESGRDLIYRLALSASGEDSPTLKLSPRDCADVLAFISVTEPVEPRTWWTANPQDAPHHVCGYMEVLHALEDALRVVRP
jgi:hypothetical protein